MAARIGPKRPVHLASVCRSSWARCNGTEQTVMLAIRAGGEKNLVGPKLALPLTSLPTLRLHSPSMTIACPRGLRILSINSPVVAL
jgi:hypothetical protein